MKKTKKAFFLSYKKLTIVSKTLAVSEADKRAYQKV